MINLKKEKNFTSKNLFGRINSLNENELGKIDSGLKWTVENIPNAVLIGGTAVVNYIKGARDLTPDLDFLVNDIGLVENRLSRDNISYNDLNPGYREPLGITVKTLNTDYLDGERDNKQLNTLILQTSRKVIVGGYNINIINPELLTIQKFESGRNKDMEDAFKLLSSGSVNKSEYVKFANKLKSYLNDYESIMNYRNFIP